MDWIEKDGVREQDNFKNLVSMNLDPEDMRGTYKEINYDDPDAIDKQIAAREKFNT